MFILYITEYFFYQIFQRNNSGSSSELIHYHGNCFLLLHKKFHQFVGGHRLRYDRYLLYVLPPIFGITEHFRRMNITHHIIDVPIINNNLGNPGFHKPVFQIFQRSRQIDSYHLCTRHNTIPYFYR